MTRTRSKCFTDAEVRAILDGRKTQFREVIRPSRKCRKMFSHQTSYPADRWWIGPHPVSGYQAIDDPSGPYRDLAFGEKGFPCPYAVGDLIRVRETWGIGTRPDPFEGWRDGIEYRADVAYLDDGDDLTLYPAPRDIDLTRYEGDSWRSPATMPPWAVRETLEVVERRCQRLQDISAEDAMAEGAGWEYQGMDRYGNHLDGWYMYERPADPGYCLGSSRAAFGNAWCRRYGKYKRGVLDTSPFDRNDWVWAITFRRKP